MHLLLGKTNGQVNCHVYFLPEELSLNFTALVYGIFPCQTNLVIAGH